MKKNNLYNIEEEINKMLEHYDLKSIDCYSQLK